MNAERPRLQREHARVARMRALSLPLGTVAMEDPTHWDTHFGIMILAERTELPWSQTVQSRLPVATGSLLARLSEMPLLSTIDPLSLGRNGFSFLSHPRCHVCIVT